MTYLQLSTALKILFKIVQKKSSKTAYSGVFIDQSGRDTVLEASDGVVLVRITAPKDKRHFERGIITYASAVRLASSCDEVDLSSTVETFYREGELCACGGVIRYHDGVVWPFIPNVFSPDGSTARDLRINPVNLARICAAAKEAGADLDQASRQSGQVLIYNFKHVKTAGLKIQAALRTVL